MNIDSEMKYIQSWSTALLEICEKLRKILDSWDASLPSDSNIKSNNILSITDSFNTLALKDIASTVLNNNWDQTKYQHMPSEIEFNEEAFQLIEELEMFKSKLEDAIGKISTDYLWQPVKHKILLIQLLAQRGLKLSKLGTN